MRLFASAILFGWIVFPAGPDAPSAARYNDNLTPAGASANGVLELALELRLARWFPLGPGGGSGDLYAFAEVGKEPLIPGPMLRVRQGTALRVKLTNTLDTVMVVRGLSARQQETLDSLVLAPGQTGEARFTADVAGTYFVPARAAQ